jgi:hypothetical protein
MNASEAASFVGMTIIVGMTTYEHDGTFVDQQQLHGIVRRVHPTEGVAIELPDGSEFHLPPAFDAIQPAPAGIYRFRSTGEAVENPDLMATFTIHKPPLH